MTALALNYLLQNTFLRKIAHSLASFVDGIGEARAMAEAFKTLSRMSDADLARYGIKRNEIPQAVMSGRVHG